MSRPVVIAISAAWLAVLGGTTFGIAKVFSHHSTEILSAGIALAILLTIILLALALTRPHYDPAYEKRKDLAEQHANCDRFLFDQVKGFIFNNADQPMDRASAALIDGDALEIEAALSDLVQLYSQNRNRRIEALEHAVDKVVEDIKLTVESTRRVLDTITGVDTAVCVKILMSRKLDSLNLTDLQTETRWRDRRSGEEDSERKKGYGTIHRVHENTITVEILAHGDPFWGSDNLLGLGPDEYKNLRTGWSKFYNATLGVGIRAYWGIPEMKYWAVLCADTREGKLYNDRCLTLMTEVAERLSVMLYRLEVLSEALKLPINKDL